MPQGINIADTFVQVGEVYEQNKFVSEAKGHFIEKFLLSDKSYNPNGNQVMVSRELAVRGITKDTSRHDFGRGGDPVSYEEILYTIPSHNQSDLITQDELEKKRVGQNPYAPVSGEEQAMRIVLEKSKGHIAKITRTKDLMSINALTLGKLEFENNKPLDFGFWSGHKITPATLWSNASSDPIKDLDAMHVLLHKDGITTDFSTYMGASAYYSFIYNEKVKAYMKDHIHGIVPAPIKTVATNSNGLQEYDSIVLPSGLLLKIKVYNEYYDIFNADSKRVGSQSIFPDKKVLVLGDNAPLVRARGSYAVLPENLRPKNMIASPVSINNGEYLQFVEAVDLTSFRIVTLSCEAPVPVSMDRVGVIEALV